MALIWEDAGTEESGDQNADTALVAHGHWAIGRNTPGWSCELIERNADGDEIPGGGVHLGSHIGSEAEAKQAAEAYESGHRLAENFTPEELQTLLRYASDALERAGEDGDLDDVPEEVNALIERLVMLARAN